MYLLLSHKLGDGEADFEGPLDLHLFTQRMSHSFHALQSMHRPRPPSSYMCPFFFLHLYIIFIIYIMSVFDKLIK